jgi:hypothetical protein
MLRHWTLALAVGVALAVTSSTRADQDPKDIIRQAIAAGGGIENLRQVHAMHVKLAGHTYERNGEARPTEDELWVQFPDRYKEVAQIEVEGQKTAGTVGMSGKDLWAVDDGVPSQLEVWRRSQVHDEMYARHLALLWPLLDGTDCTLTIVPAAAVKGRPVVGVMVAKTGQPDVTLCFDRENHLLVKKQTQSINPQTPGGKSLQEEVLSEYRDADYKSDDEKRLREARLRTDDAELLAYLKQQTVPERERVRAQKLIEQLGDPSFEVRAKAQEELAKVGASAAPLFAHAAQSRDAEIASAAKEWLQKTNTKISDTEITGSVLRLLGARKTPGALEAILVYLPSASSDSLASEAQNALVELATVDGKPDAALQKFTGDADSLRRSTAEKLQSGVARPRNETTSRRLSLKGVKYPYHLQQFRDGRKEADFKVVELELYSRLPDEVFAKP